MLTLVLNKQRKFFCKFNNCSDRKLYIDILLIKFNQIIKMKLEK